MIMNIYKHLYILSYLLFINFLFAKALPINNTYYEQIQEKLILAQPGDTIFLPEGKIHLKRSLWADNLKNVIITGHGMDNTIISFKNQIEGAEGLKITNSSNIILKDFTIQDTKGDLIKAEDVSNISFINLKCEWTGRPKKTNGGYGLYPVKSNNILIDNCLAIGASDAGIYVGQSRNIIVKNSETYHNVAGIEIENSTNADVYNNFSHNNSGGILVFDLPDLEVKSGKNIRVFNNIILDNNIRNFAPAGNIVGSVPSGTGIMVLATSNVEIFNNKIYNNKTANTSIVSYHILEETITDSTYYPYPRNIFIHDNIYKRHKRLPSLSFKQPLGILLAIKFFNNVPDIIFDGILDDKNIGENSYIPICINNNINSTFLNLDAGNNFKNISIKPDDFECTLPKINPTILE